MDPFYDDFDQLHDAILMDDGDGYLTSSLGGGATLPPPPPPEQGSATLPPPPPPPERGSAFAAYHQQHGTAEAATSPGPALMSRRRLYNDSSGGGGGGAANAHRRMFGYLSRIGSNAASTARNAVEDGDAMTITAQVPRGGGSSRFRHIMRERLRRERLSQGFADLHALLPPGTSKGGKIDIVGAAAGYIVELERRRQCLRARNEELILQQAARTRTEERPGGGMVVKVRAQSERHSVAVDVFEIVLRRLKAMEALRVTGVRSCFRGGGGGGMWMNVGVECQVPACDVDKAITNTLTRELEEFGMQVPRSSRPAFTCQVERGGVPMC